MNSTEVPVMLTRGSLVCRNVYWTDIVQFILFNYLLHAVTVLSGPGDGTVPSIQSRLVALFLPLAGTIRAVGVIHRFARGEREPLHIALRARALCMVHRPVPDQGGPEASVNSLALPPFPREVKDNYEEIVADHVTIQGQHPVTEYNTLPNAPRLVHVPVNYIVQPPLANLPEIFNVAYNYNVAKILAAIAQILYGSFQIFRTSGPGIEKYGYAGYQLTIVPYIIMSLINLLAALCEPEFPAMFLVESDKQDGQGEISGQVGSVAAPATAESVHTIRMQKSPILECALLTLCGVMIALAIVGPYLIIYALTDFKLGHNSGTVEYTFDTTAPAFAVFNQWVIIWVLYGQYFTLMRYWRANRKISNRFRVSRIILSDKFLIGAGALICIYGFSCVMRLMVNDIICVVL